MRLIDADRLLEILEREEVYHSDLPQRADGVRDAIMDVISAPTVDAVPVVHGRWNCSDDLYESAICSCCGWDTTEPWGHIKNWFQFCPNCGAKMDGKDDDNETD